MYTPMYGSPFGLFSGWNLLGLLIALVVCILYLRTLMKTLQAVSPGVRKMEPGLVFLLLIPLFNLIWNFFVVYRIRDSLQQEFANRQMSGSGFGFGVGMAMSVLSVLSFIPVAGLLIGLAAFICWIIYWIQIAGYGKQLRPN